MNSPTIAEPTLQAAIVTAIRDLAAESDLGDAATLLKTHIGIYFGGDDSIAVDEMRAKELVAKITAAASTGSYTNEMAALVSELNAVKQRIAGKKQKSKVSEATLYRLSEVTNVIDSIRGSDIQYDNVIVRRLIECVRVMAPDEIEITFKGMRPKRYPLK